VETLSEGDGGAAVGFAVGRRAGSALGLSASAGGQPQAQHQDGGEDQHSGSRHVLKRTTSAVRNTALSDH